MPNVFRYIVSVLKQIRTEEGEPHIHPCREKYQTKEQPKPGTGCCVQYEAEQMRSLILGGFGSHCRTFLAQNRERRQCNESFVILYTKVGIEVHHILQLSHVWINYICEYKYHEIFKNIMKYFFVQGLPEPLNCSALKGFLGLFVWLYGWDTSCHII